MNYRQNESLLLKEDLNKILTQFSYQFVGTSPTVEPQNIDVLPQDELYLTETEMILKKYASFVLPSGPTSERPASTVEGAIRLNTDTGLFESFNGSSWTGVGGGGGLEFNEGGYQIEGENLCTNGTFDIDVSGWTADIEWDSTAGGRALVDNCVDSGCEAAYEFEVVESGYYLVEFDADPSVIAAVYFDSGSRYVEANGKTILVDYLEAGTETINIGNYYQTTGQKMWIDNVQIFKVASNIPIPNLELGEEYKMFLTPVTTYLGNSPNPGISNIGFGYNSLYANTTGYANTALGYISLYANTIGNANTALGYYSLYANTTGNDNTAVGTYSLFSNTTGDENTALGTISLFSNTTGNYNTAVGTGSLYENTTGYANIAVGTGSLYENTTGYANTAVGTQALQANTTGSENTALGYYSLFANTTGSENTALGYYSLFANTTGSTNTAVGYLAYEIGTYSNSTAIGYQAQPTKSNQIILGNNNVEELKVRNYVFNVDQTVGAAQDGWVLKYNHSTGQAEFAAP